MKRIVIALIALMLLCACAPSDATVETSREPEGTVEPYSITSILEPKNLAYIRKDVISRTVSSYDRSGQNKDGLRYQSLAHKKGLVLLEQNQPGVITRIWIGGLYTEDKAALHIYIDGSDIPVISGTLESICSGEYKNLVKPLVGKGYDSSGACYIYLPITFAKSIKIVGDNLDWFQINYDLYPCGTRFVSYTGQEDTTPLKNAVTLEREYNSEERVTKGEIAIDGGKTAELFSFSGSAGIGRIKLGLDEIIKVKKDNEVMYKSADSGRAYMGYTEFTAKIDPLNNGVRIERLQDGICAEQITNIYVDGVLVGQINTGDKRQGWITNVIDIPGELTAGKSQIRIRSEFVSSGGDINEFYYTAYSLLDGKYVKSDGLDVADTQSEGEHDYVISNQTWVGEREYHAPQKPLADEDIPINERTAQILNGTDIRITCDGTVTVDMALAEFFATGYWGLGDIAISGYLIGYKDGYLYCNYVMPFENEVKIELINNTDTKISGSYEVAVDPNGRLTDEKGYFKAEKHRMESEFKKPFIFLEAEGSGNVVGVTQLIYNTTGEGFIEGDDFLHVNGYSPAVLGTGTEDIYNAGFHFRYGSFSQWTHGATKQYYDASYRLTMHREFIADAVSFVDGVGFYVEHGGNNDGERVDSTLVCYYYHREDTAATLTDTVDCMGNEVTGVYQGYYNRHKDTLTGFDVDVAEITVKLDKDNKGVILYRSYVHKNVDASARVYVDGQLVGTWSPQDIALSEWTRSIIGVEGFVLPKEYTEGKNSITVRFEAVSGEWPMYRFSAYSLK